MDAQSSPSAKIFTLVKFHATLATLLLALTTTFTPIPQASAPPSHHHHNTTHLALTNTLAYLHLWCATLGFIWWYAAHATTTTDPAPDNEQQQPQQQQRRKENQGWVQAG